MYFKIKREPPCEGTIKTIYVMYARKSIIILYKSSKKSSIFRKIKYEYHLYKIIGERLLKNI